MAAVVKEYGGAVLAAVGGVVFLGTLGQFLLSRQGLIMQMIEVWETEAVDERTDQTIRRHGNRGCDGTGIDCAGVGNQRGCGKGNSKEPRTV